MKIISTAVHIVMLGRFAPDKFSLNSLAEGKLIPKSVADTASYVSLIPGSHVHVKLAWGEVMVTQDRLQVTTREFPYIRICDFSLKAINDLNPDALVTSFGINYDRVLDVGSRKNRNALGMRLAPPEAWGSWGTEIQQSMDGDETLQGGVTHIQMRQQFRDNGVQGWLDVSAMPSHELPQMSGVLLRANHHHQCAPADAVGEKIAERPGAITESLMTRLSENFEGSIERIESIFKGIVST